MIALCRAFVPTRIEGHGEQGGIWTPTGPVCIDNPWFEEIEPFDSDLAPDVVKFFDLEFVRRRRA
jgi:hypothetical protein